MIDWLIDWLYAILNFKFHCKWNTCSKIFHIKRWVWHSLKCKWHQILTYSKYNRQYNTSTFTAENIPYFKESGQKICFGTDAGKSPRLADSTEDVALPNSPCALRKLGVFRVLSQNVASIFCLNIKKLLALKQVWGLHAMQ